METTIAKNLVLIDLIASGYVFFGTGVTATGSFVSANVTAPGVAVSLYMLSMRSKATATDLTVKVSNTRAIGASGSSVPFELTNISFTTGQSRDVLVEGIFGGNASGINFDFSNVSALATAGNYFTAEYQLWAVR